MCNKDSFLLTILFCAKRPFSFIAINFDVICDKNVASHEKVHYWKTDLKMIRLREKKFHFASGIQFSSLTKRQRWRNSNESLKGIHPYIADIISCNEFTVLVLSFILHRDCIARFLRKTCQETIEL